MDDRAHHNLSYRMVTSLEAANDEYMYFVKVAFGKVLLLDAASLRACS